MENRPPIEEITEEDIENSSSFEDIKLHKSAKKQHSPLASFTDKIKDYTVNSVILTYQLVNDMPRLFMCLSPKDKHILFKRAFVYSILHDIYYCILIYTPIKKYKETLPLLPITIYSSLLATVLLLTLMLYFTLHKEENLSYRYSYDGEYNEELYDKDGYLIVSNNEEDEKDNQQNVNVTKANIKEEIKSHTNILDIDNIVKDNVSHETLNKTQLNDENFNIPTVPKVAVSNELQDILSDLNNSTNHMNN